MRVVIAFIALLLWVGTAHAEVLQLEGTIKSVDAAKREITIGRKTLDVAKKCRITVDGTDAEVGDLRADQDAKVEYDSELEVAKSIAVAAAAVVFDADAYVEDLRRLQGEWRPVEGHWNGQPINETELRRLNQRITIKGNTLRQESVGGSDVLNVVEGLYAINPKTHAFDLIGRSTKHNGVYELVGIYEVDADTLKLCCRLNGDGKAERPTVFQSVGDGPPNWSTFYVYKRAK